MPGAEINPKGLPELILVDTNVFSYFFRGSPEADLFRSYFGSRVAALSFMSVAELYYGAFHARWGASRVEHLETRIGEYVILPYDEGLCLRWGQLKAECETNGCPLDHADLWIAACALHHGCALATNNVQHFRNVAGLQILGPEDGLP
ncbi:MAG: PIN domain-containing protein [Chloroflexi bacterium]|nr:PIN domain-containing protein [Chloroflexota bacterium]